MYSFSLLCTEDVLILFLFFAFSFTRATAASPAGIGPYYLGSNWLTKACTSNTECSQVNAECFSGQCLCTPGYYFCTSLNSCHRSKFGQGSKLAGAGGGMSRKFEFCPAKCWSWGYPRPNTRYFQRSKRRSYLEIPLVFVKDVGESVPGKTLCSTWIPLITLTYEFNFSVGPELL